MDHSFSPEISDVFLVSFCRALGPGTELLRVTDITTGGGVTVIHYPKSKCQLTGREEDARSEESAEMWHQHGSRDKPNRDQSACDTRTLTELMQLSKAL